MDEGPSGLDTVIMLFRKDLRLDDNPALLAALQAATNVVPVFIWSPEEEGQFSPGRCSKWWIKQSVQALAEQINSLGSRLIVRKAQATVDILLQLLQETGAKAVFFNHLFDPISLVRDHVMKQQLTAAGATCHSYNADLLYEPWTVLDSTGEPLTTFNTFLQQLRSMPQQPPVLWPVPAVLPAVSASLASTALDDIPFFSSREQEQATAQLGLKWTAGPEGGRARLEQFLSDALQHFSHQKARVDHCVSSRLSPWIKMGSISVRVIYDKVQAKQQKWLAEGADHASSCQDFLQQLAYREYSRYLSFHFPLMHERPLLSHLRCVAWNLDQSAFKAWKMGMTGYPLVDAAMKELWSTGWMHNRLRVVCGVFAVKYLLLPWQWGLKHYWDQLLDADLESDALGWQYLSGCMADAPPFGDWMDITAEAASFDPEGEYVRRWLPVLARMPSAWIHAPWTAPQEVLEAADVELGLNYPLPIVSLQDAVARLQDVAAAIQQNLEEQQQLSQPQAGGSQPHQQQLSGSKQPYRPPTQLITCRYSKAHLDAAAAAAANMQQQRSSMVLPPQEQQQSQQQQQQPPKLIDDMAAAITATAQCAAVKATAQCAAVKATAQCAAVKARSHEAAPGDAIDNKPLLAAGAAAAAAAPNALQDGPEAAAAAEAEAEARQPWQQQQPPAAWQIQALQNDGHLRQEYQQQRHERQWRQQQQRQQYGSRKRRYERWQQHGYHGRGLWLADKEASGDDRDAYAAWRQQLHDDGYDGGYDSDCSEVNSNAPPVSEAVQTACSGIAWQPEEGKEVDLQQWRQQTSRRNHLKETEERLQQMQQRGGNDRAPHQEQQEQEQERQPLLQQGVQGRDKQMLEQQQKQPRTREWLQQCLQQQQDELVEHQQCAAEVAQFAQQQQQHHHHMHLEMELQLPRQCTEGATEQQVQGDDRLGGVPDALQDGEQQQLLRQQAWMQQLLGNFSD